ncbi:PEP-CTERM-box response regulator transcription factor [Paremcibacter congregatus]|uniref:PEP-CTERM-box response regulator transcription factor n=1 Tax=Paremcibacter congregatus TaxID=2043170 RepID=A0A2G4YN45_9PROT|nr:PEP-CTERM-box response regulator transcription factor [Paremcibacter congregatus]PHZ83759.1 PEP-CTERM-box response regulator transcription factor [Paremcibacter congregatus]QDE27460.1 PEP-CTERM-box response regulator transcription factor [Paremcibacter congregatus]
MTEEKRNLMVVEDDPGLQRQYKWNFEAYSATIAGDRTEALAILAEKKPAVVTLDLGLPPDPDGTTEGFATLEEILKVAPHTKVIVASGHGAHESALKAINMGAYDFYEKPVDPDQLGLIVDRAFRLYDLEAENRRLAEAAGATRFQGLITGCDSMYKVCDMVERVAPANVSVMLLGASGTGKELLARAVHNLSDRKDGRFVAINCAAIPENLLESELFGYEKGAFTGAVKQTIGKIEMAQGGTLFLDEIGDLQFPLQVKLLRFLQERVIERIGGRREIPVDVRVVCATHQDLEGDIANGNFREDLFYRLSEIIINIPTLADREGDAILLSKAFLSKFNDDLKKQIMGFSQDALVAIASYNWPGNVRELENRIKRSVIMCNGKKITADDLELNIKEDQVEVLNLKVVRENADIRAINKAMAQASGNVSRAAKILGVSRPTFYGLVKQYDIVL